MTEKYAESEVKIDELVEATIDKAPQKTPKDDDHPFTFPGPLNETEIIERRKEKKKRRNKIQNMRC